MISTEIPCGNSYGGIFYHIRTVKKENPLGRYVSIKSTETASGGIENIVNYPEMYAWQSLDDDEPYIEFTFNMGCMIITNYTFVGYETAAHSSMWDIYGTSNYQTEIVVKDQDGGEFCQPVYENDSCGNKYLVTFSFPEVNKCFKTIKIVGKAFKPANFKRLAFGGVDFFGKLIIYQCERESKRISTMFKYVILIINNCK